VVQAVVPGPRCSRRGLRPPRRDASRLGPARALLPVQPRRQPHVAIGGCPRSRTRALVDVALPRAPRSDRGGRPERGHRVPARAVEIGPARPLRGARRPLPADTGREPCDAAGRGRRWAAVPRAHQAQHRWLGVRHRRVRHAGGSGRRRRGGSRRPGRGSHRARPGACARSRRRHRARRDRRGPVPLRHPPGVGTGHVQPLPRRLLRAGRGHERRGRRSVARHRLPPTRRGDRHGRTDRRPDGSEIKGK